MHDAGAPFDFNIRLHPCSKIHSNHMLYHLSTHLETVGWTHLRELPNYGHVDVLNALSSFYATLNLHLRVLVICMFSFRLEEKLSNVESENKVLRQQAVSMAPSKILSGRSKSNLQVNQFVQLWFTLCSIL